MAAGMAFGIRGGARSGLLVALGHAVVEFPLVLALGAGIIPLELFPHSRLVISILGGAGLLAFAVIQVRSALRSGIEGQTPRILERYGAFAVGIGVSALNPFFLAWWATAGLKLVADSQALWPLWGPQILFAIHIPLDIVWLCATAALAKRGMQLSRGPVRRIVELGLAAVMATIGILFILGALG